MNSHSGFTAAEMVARVQPMLSLLQNPFPGLSAADLASSNQCRKTKVTFPSCSLECVAPFSKCFSQLPLFYFMEHKLFFFTVKTFTVYLPPSITSEFPLKG